MHKNKLLQIVTKNYKMVTNWKHRRLSQAAPRTGGLKKLQKGYKKIAL